MTTKETTLSPDVLALALGKVKGNRDNVGPGKYAGRAVVTVDYALTVGEGYRQRIVAKVPWIALAAVLMSKVNGTTLESAMREALTVANGSDALTELEARADDIMEALTEATMTECRGKVTGSATVVDVVAS